jgi:hypothetical protein
MFRNDGGLAFQDVTTSGGFGHLQKGHGVAFGDINQDGQEDIFEVIGGALPGDSYQSVLFANPGHDNHWITLDLQGVQTNRSAFGARVTLTLQTPTGERHIYRTVGYGSSFGGNPLRQHIGIGKSTTISEIEISWPTSRSVQKFRDVAADGFYRIRESTNAIQPVTLVPFPLGNSGDGHAHHR